MTMKRVLLQSAAVALPLLAPVSGLLWPAFGGDPFMLPTPRDAVWLLTLAVVCTLLPFALFLVALRRLSAFAAQLSVNLEPVYAIALAAVLLGEQQELTPAFYLGVAVILAVVLAYPLLLRPQRIAHPELAATGEAKALGE